MSSDFESELPEDPGYWDRMAGRINADAAGPLADYADARLADGNRRWYGPLARRAPWVVAASAAAALFLWFELPARDSIALEWIERSLTPTDGAGTLVVGTSPPSVDELLVQFSPGLVEEESR